MNPRNRKAMANRIARKIVSQEDEEALINVDTAVDAMIAASIAIQENLPLVNADTVPEKAAVDTVEQLMNEAILPYLADIAKALEAFGGE